MKLSEIRVPKGANKKKKRVGRGPGSGHGKTSCRGHKGRESRTGGKKPGFEGGQTPLERRVPKRGFRNPFKEYISIVNLDTLNKFEKGSIVDIVALKNAGFIKNSQKKVKILGSGKISKPLIVKASKFSEGARKKIEEVGGKIEILC